MGATKPRTRYKPMSLQSGPSHTDVRVLAPSKASQDWFAASENSRTKGACGGVRQQLAGSSTVSGGGRKHLSVQSPGGAMASDGSLHRVSAKAPKPFRF